MRKLLAIIRIIWILWWIPLFIGFYFISGSILGWKIKRALVIRRYYIKLVNWGLGLKINVIGDIPSVPGLYVSNHRNFLDPFIALQFIDALPIAKSEIANYPFIGKGAKITGVVYVNRDKKSSRTSTLNAIKDWINDGYRILIYPEGTVHNGPTTRPFKPGAFYVAAQEGFEVIPIAIEYRILSDHWPDDVALWPFTVQVLGKWHTHVTLSIGKTIPTSKTELTSLTQDWINSEITSIRESYNPKMKSS